MEDKDNGVVSCPVRYAVRTVELALSCMPPGIPLLLAFCTSLGGNGP